MSTYYLSFEHYVSGISGDHSRGWKPCLIVFDDPDGPRMFLNCPYKNRAMMRNVVIFGDNLSDAEDGTTHRMVTDMTSEMK